MKKRKFALCLSLIMILSIIFQSGIIRANALSNYVSGTRNIDKQVIYKDQDIEVNLDITGTPPVNVVKPNDVIMIMDKSGSMQQDNRFKSMIDSAKEFVDLVDFKYHKVGIVDFSSDANTFDLSSNPNDIKKYIDTIQCGGGTETGVSIRKAMEVFKNGSRPDAQPAIVLLTDGQANSTEDARKAAEEAKNAGIVFYTIALLAPNENPDGSAPNELMKEMATTSHHHHFVLGSVGLLEIYKAIVKEIGISSAYDVVVTETVGPEFEIVEGSYDNNIPKPVVKDNTLTWNMLELKGEILSFKYKVKLKLGQEAKQYCVNPNTTINYKDYAGAKRTYRVDATYVNVKNYAPEIVSLSQEKSKIDGGEELTITGKNFRQGVNVKFGNNWSKNTKVVDENTIIAKIEPGQQGKSEVTLQNDDKQSATAPFYYYADPTITSITPNEGPFEGGNAVKIYGTYFMPNMKVYFGDKQADSVKYYNSTYAIAYAPEATSEEQVDVKVVNEDTTNFTLPKSYNYLPKIIPPQPKLTSISPNEGPFQGGNGVKIYGENLEKGLKVKFGDVEVKDITYYNSTYIIAYVPQAAKEGLVDIKIENPDGQFAELKDGYKYLEKPSVLPQIASISPNSGEIAGGNIVYVEGKNFGEGAKVKFGSKEAEIINFYSSDKMRVKVPEGTTSGKIDLSVVNTNGDIGILKDGYEYLEPVKLPVPEILSLSSNSGKIEGNEIIYIEGNSFVNGMKVTFGDKQASILSFYNEKRIRVKVPEGSQGKVDVKIINPDGQEAILKDAYEYLPPPPPPAPEITKLSAQNGTLEGGEIIYIDGNNFIDGLKVKFGNNDATVLNVYNPTKIRIKIPAGVEGKVDVTLTNPDGQDVTLSNAYEYLPPPPPPAPEISTLSYDVGPIKGGEIIYINGKNFVSGLKVKFGANEAQVLNYYSDTRIRVKVPESTISETVDVVLVNPDGQECKSKYTYEKTLPEITGLSVDNGKLEGGDFIYVDGKNLTSDLSIKVIKNGKEEIIPTSSVYLYGPTRIRVKMPTSPDKTPGEATMIITTLSGEASAKYTYNEPPKVPDVVLNKFTTAGEVELTTVSAGAVIYLRGSGFNQGYKLKIVGNGTETIIAPYNIYDAYRMRFRVPYELTKGSYTVTIIDEVLNRESNPKNLEIN